MSADTEAVGLKDLLDRIASLRLPGAEQIRYDDLTASTVSEAFFTLCCNLAGRLANTSDSAKLAAKALLAAQRDGPKLDRALEQLDKAVCGQSSKQLTRPESLARLVAHLQATQLLELAKKGTIEVAQTSEGFTSDEASQGLQDIAQLLQSSEAGQSAQQQLQSILVQLDHMMAQLPTNYFDSLVPEASLNASQREHVDQIFGAMQQEYRVRRKMLIERAKVTLQSMLWSKEWLESQGTTQQAAAAAQQGADKLQEDPAVTLEDLFEARVGDILAVTSNATSGNKGKFEATVKSVLMGKVPDRGGRPEEGRAAAAVAAMPAWAPRSTSHGSKGAGDRGSHPKGGRHGRGDSGRGQGGRTGSKPALGGGQKGN